MSSSETFFRICTELGFFESKGLVTSEDLSNATPEQAQFLRKSIKQFKIDAIYFVQLNPDAASIPVIYFKRFESLDMDFLRNLHRRIWNSGRVPLLFIILPGEIRIYNSFAPPPEYKDEEFDTEKRLLKSLSTLKDVQQELKEFNRLEIDSGNYWRKFSHKFDLQNKADKHLLKNLRNVCNKLNKKGLPFNYVHTLIGRSIFILYLQDRKILNDFYKNFQNGKYDKFTDILPNKRVTYNLFKMINKQFNGDIFPIYLEEIRMVSEEHLNLIRQFLEGTDPVTGQTRLWPYCFDVIPIEFISSVYEEFFHHERKGLDSKTVTEKGTHYTPQFLVEFMLDEILPWNDDEINVKILDPACGSGIFLVNAYKRLIERYMKSNEITHVDFSTMVDILTNNIFGIDINEEAISIAAFSLYLTMLDFLDKESIWEEVRFPILRNNNLFIDDFFSEDARFNNLKFDIIIGNPPWERISEEYTDAISYCRKNDFPIGGKQIAQAFLWRAKDFCEPDGEMVFLITAKGLLFNRSDRNRQFRRKFFETFDVKTVINLSILRHNIFDKSVSPPAIVFYKLNDKKTSEEKQVLYIVPKTSTISKYLGSIVIDISNISDLPRDIILTDDFIWKVAMWGTPRDHSLIRRVLEKGTLKEFADNMNWEIGDGFQEGGGDENSAPWMINIPFLSTRLLKRFYVSQGSVRQHTKRIFHRPRSKKRFIAPLCLMKATLYKGKIAAAFFDFDVCYRDGILGISGDKKDEDMLKIITCYLNSNVARYFLFLQSSVWGVERDDILKDDILNIPFIMPDTDSSSFKSLIEIYNKIRSLEDIYEDEVENLIKRIDTIFMKLFSFNKYEKILVQDTVKYTITQFQKKEKSISFKPVTKSEIKSYAEIFNDMIKDQIFFTKKSVKIIVYFGAMPLNVVSLEISDRKSGSKIRVVDASTDLKEILHHLDKLLLEKHSTGIYVQRNVKIFDNETIYIVKPNEKRYWTRSRALNDVDEYLANVFKTWKDMR